MFVLIPADANDALSQILTVKVWQAARFLASRFAAIFRLQPKRAAPRILNVMPSYQYIDSDPLLERYLDEICDASWIAYDTEFISEGRYFAELCLVQVATEFGAALIDPLQIDDLTPFWERLCRADTVAIAHSCRSELDFCYRAVDRFPTNVFDVQLAAAFVGFDYPLNYKALAAETIGVSISKNETRTDWSRRPLTDAQLDYALHDVCDLKQIADFLTVKLEESGRTAWFLEETKAYCETLKNSFDETDGWQKSLGVKQYGRDELAIIRALWQWRRRKATQTNTPPSRIFRDDLIMELAKRKTADPVRIAAVRGVHGSPTSSLTLELSATIGEALALPNDEKPRNPPRSSYPHYALATQLLGLVLNQHSASLGVAPRLLSTSSDVRQAIAARENVLPKSVQPRLTTGWRAKFLGRFVDDWLDGQYAMRFSKNLENTPLEIVDLRATEE